MVPPLVHKYVNGEVPPLVIATVAEPVEEPQVDGEEVEASTIGAGLMIETAKVDAQPMLSVTVA